MVWTKMSNNIIILRRSLSTHFIRMHLTNLTSNGFLAFVCCINDVLAIQLSQISLSFSTLGYRWSRILPWFLSNKEIAKGFLFFVRFFIWSVTSTLFSTPFLFKLFSFDAHVSKIFLISNLDKLIEIIISWIIFFVFFCFWFWSCLNHQLLYFKFWHDCYDISLALLNSILCVFFIIINTSFKICKSSCICNNPFKFV